MGIVHTFLQSGKNKLRGLYLRALWKSGAQVSHLSTDDLILALGIDLNEKTYSDNEELRVQFQNERPGLSFRRTGPNSAINDQGDILTVGYKEACLHYKKVDGKELRWRKDFGHIKGVLVYKIFQPRDPAWEGMPPFSKEELKEIEDEIRYALYILDASAVLFYDRDYLDWLQELEPATQSHVQ